MARKRGFETFGDVLRSLVIVLIPVAFVAGIVGLVRPSSETIRDVDWEGSLDVAREDAGYEVVGPESVPEDWTATQVSYRPAALRPDGVWRMNFVTDQGTYIGLVQRVGELEAVVAEELPGFEPNGTSTVDGRTWQRMVEADSEPDRALVQARPDSVVVILGSGGYSELESFVSWLR